MEWQNTDLQTPKQAGQHNECHQSTPVSVNPRTLTGENYFFTWCIVSGFHVSTFSAMGSPEVVVW